MTSNDENADSAPTSAGAGATDETTNIPAAAEATPDLAWSLDDGDAADQPSGRHSWDSVWVRAAAVLGLAVAVAVVVGVGGFVMSPPRQMVVNSRPPSPPTTATVEAAPPASTTPYPGTGITLQPSTTTTHVYAPFSPVADKFLVNYLLAEGWTISDPGPFIRAAHSACQLIRQGRRDVSDVGNEISIQTGPEPLERHHARHRGESDLSRLLLGQLGRRRRR
jgi:hypothetical protein